MVYIVVVGIEGQLVADSSQFSHHLKYCTTKNGDRQYLFAAVLSLFGCSTTRVYFT